MAIIQISKIQQRSGDLVDLPQLDEAEFGFASDEKRLFIGKEDQPENIEVLTSYSQISFNQLEGAVGNLDINPLTAEDGQVLTYDGNNWVNRGGESGGLINLGEVSNLKISGGAIGYVLETDGTGNLSWSPKSTIIAFIENIQSELLTVHETYATQTFSSNNIIDVIDSTGYVSGAAIEFTGTGFGNISSGNIYYIRNVISNTQITITDNSNIANSSNLTLTDDSGNLTLNLLGTLLTTTEDNFFVEGVEVTITDSPGMVELNGGSYFVDILTSNTMSLYQDIGLTLPVDSSNYTLFPYTNVSNTYSNSAILVGNAALFSNGDPVRFIGTTFGGIIAETTYYVISTSGSTITVSTTEGGSALPLLNASGSCSVYVTGGRVISAVGGSGATAAGGSTTTVQFNFNNILEGNSSFTFDPMNSLLTLNGNANVNNINVQSLVTASRLISNISTGTPPIIVNSTTRVANLNVAYSNVTDFVNITTATTGVYYPIIANGLTGNVGEFANSALSFNAATGNLSATLLTGTITTQAQPNITSLGNGTQVTVNGNLNPSGNVTQNLGNSTNRWNDIWLSGSTIYLGNATIESIAAGVLITNANGGSFLIGGNSAANTSALVNGNSNVIVSANGNVNISVAGTANVLRVTSTGVNVAGTLNATGNANVGNLGTAGLITATGNITGGNLNTAGVVNATGNVSGGNLTTAGALSVTGNANVGNIGGTNGIFTTVTGGLLTNAQPNITSVGTLTSLTIAANGNITMSGVNSQLSGPNLVSANFLTGTLTTGSQPNINAIGTLSNLTVTGNILAGNVYANSGAIGASLLTGTLTTAAQPNITSVGTLTSLNVTGNIAAGNLFANSGLVRATTLQGTALTTGATATAGTITGNWTLSGGSRLTATYADLAEYYSADANYLPGTVLEFGGEQEVTIAGIETNKLAGVVTTDPAYVMNGNLEAAHPVIIALVGRVPVRVTGHVSKGDMLISAGNGFAKASIMTPKIGTVIGKSIQNKWDDGEGIVEVMVGRI